MNLLLNFSQSLFNVAIKLVFLKDFKRAKFTEFLAIAKSRIFWFLLSKLKHFLLMLPLSFQVDFLEDSKLFRALIPQMLLLAFGAVIKHFLIVFANADAIDE